MGCSRATLMGVDAPPATTSDSVTLNARDLVHDRGWSVTSPMERQSRPFRAGSNRVPMVGLRGFEPPAS